MEVERAIVSLGFVTKGAREALSTYQRVISGAAAAASAAIGLTVAVAHQDDELIKTADDLGLTAEGYDSLRLAMEGMGVTQEQLNQGLRSLQQRIASAANGSTEAARAFGRVPFLDTAGKARTAADVMEDLAASFDGLSGGELRSRSLLLFGESGIRLGRVLGEAGEQVKATRQDIIDLGLALDETSGRNAEGLIDALGLLQAAGTSLARTVSDQVAPPLTRLIDSLTRWLAAGDGLIRLGLESFAKGVGVALRALENDAVKVAATIGLLGVAFTGATGPASLLSGTILAGVVPALTTAATTAAPFVLAFALLGLAVDEVWTTMQGGDSLLRRLADQLGITDEVANLFRQSTRLLGEAWQLTTLLLGRAFDSAVEFGGYLVGELMSGLQSAREGVEDWSPTLASWIESLESALSVLTSIGDYIPSLAGLLGFAGDAVGMLADDYADANFQLAGGVGVADVQLQQGGLIGSVSQASQAAAGFLQQQVTTGVQAAADAPIITLAPTVNFSANEIRSGINQAVNETRRQLTFAQQSLAGGG